MRKLLKTTENIINRFPGYFWIAVVCIVSTTNDAFAAGDELLSFDSTVVIEFFIFVVAIYVLNKLLFQPLVNIRYRREDLTVVKMEEARKLNEDLEKRVNEYKNKIDSAREEAYEQRGEIRKQAQEQAEEIVAEARKEAEQQVEKYKQELASEVKDIKQSMKPQIESLAKNIASRVLAKEV